jgi:hypothetical protein
MATTRSRSGVAPRHAVGLDSINQLSDQPACDSESCIERSFAPSKNKSSRSGLPRRCRAQRGAPHFHGHLQQDWLIKRFGFRSTRRPEGVHPHAGGRNTRTAVHEIRGGKWSLQPRRQNRLAKAVMLEEIVDERCSKLCRSVRNAEQAIS